MSRNSRACPFRKASEQRTIRGRVIKELGLRRTDLIITTKLFWGVHGGPNDGGLSRKQYVRDRWSSPTTHILAASSREPKSHWNALVLTMLTLSSPTVQMCQVMYLLLSRVVSDDSVRKTVPMEETVRAFSWVIEKGWVRYLDFKP